MKVPLISFLHESLLKGIFPVTLQTLGLHVKTPFSTSDRTFHGIIVVIVNCIVVSV